MADNERLTALRQALDDAVLTHTGRSIGDLASERVLADIMPEIMALSSEGFDKLSQQYHAARERWQLKMERLTADANAMRPIVEAVAESDGRMWRLWDGTPAGYGLLPKHEGIITQARAFLASEASSAAGQRTAAESEGE